MVSPSLIPPSLQTGGAQKSNTTSLRMELLFLGQSLLPTQAGCWCSWGGLGVIVSNSLPGKPIPSHRAPAFAPPQCTSTKHNRCQPGTQLSRQKHVPGRGQCSGDPAVLFPVQLSIDPEGRQGLICRGFRFVFPNDSHQGSPGEARA